MKRQRKNAEDNWMPPRVYLKGPSYFFRPRGGGAIKLCSADKAQSFVWYEYEKLINENTLSYTVNKLINEFLESSDYKDLSPSTKSDYRKNSKNIILVFGKMDAERVEPKHIRAYMDKRGLSSRVQANREKAFFSRAYRWAYERGKVKLNPCKGVKQFTERARDKYITDSEYELVYRLAPPAVKVAMELSYLCAARKGDVLTMKWSQIQDDGIFIQQGKTGVKQIKLWSKRLVKAIRMAESLSNNALRPYIVVKSDGHPYTENGFNSAWQYLMKQAREQSGWPLDFTFHDIKAKAISDVGGTSKDKQKISGHKTESQVSTYDRSIKRVPAVDDVKENP